MTPVDFKPVNSIQLMSFGFFFDTGTIPHFHFLYEKNINKHIHDLCKNNSYISDDVEQIRIYYICMNIMKHHIYYYEQQIIMKKKMEHSHTNASLVDTRTQHHSYTE